MKLKLSEQNILNFHLPAGGLVEATTGPGEVPPLASPLFFLEPHLIGVPSSSLTGLLVGVLLPRRLEGVAGSRRRGVVGRPGEDIAK